VNTDCETAGFALSSTGCPNPGSVGVLQPGCVPSNWTTGTVLNAVSLAATPNPTCSTSSGVNSGMAAPGPGGSTVCCQ
jgi:hypothetical protein